MANFFGEDVEEKLKKEQDKRDQHDMWIEKYRPVTLDTFIGNESITSKIKKYIETGDVPHLLFSGTPGTGKTTLSKIIVNNIECDYLYLNASDENSVDTVREKIKSFASSVGFKDIKIIILDESDALTRQAQAALRNIIETFSLHTRFILTCNDIGQMHTAIMSRCQVFDIKPPSKKEIAIHLAKILKSESVSYNPSDLVILLDKYYPDIRGLVKETQKFSPNGTLEIDIDKMIDSDFKLKIVDILVDKSKDRKASFKEIRQLFADNSISNFTDCYKFLYEKVDEYAVGNIAPVILILSEQEYKSAFCVDKEINFCSTIIQLLEKVK